MPPTQNAIEEGLTTMVPGLLASEPHPLPFAPSLHARSFLLRREDGNLLVYSAPGAAGLGALGPATRLYVGHWHETMFAPEGLDAPIVVHRADAEQAAARVHVRGSFSRRHTVDGDFEVIPMPGHTPGSTAYLWNSGEQRVLFTADTIYLSDGEWIAAVLDSSDRAAYLESLELLASLDFDVLVPWAATAGQPYVAPTDRDDARRRIAAIAERVRGGSAS